MDAMRRMALFVDLQRAGAVGYQAMAPDFDGPAFRAACALVVNGRAHPSGDTELTLRSHRLEKKRHTPIVLP